MKKEDILEKSRQANYDEGIEYVENQGRKVGFVCFTILFLILSIFNLFFGDSNTFLALSSLFWAFIAGDAYEKNRFLKRKAYSIAAAFGIIASFISIINYFMVTLR